MAKSFDEMDWDELMELEARQSEPLELSDEEVQRFNYRTVLYKMDQGGYRAPLMPDDPNAGAAFLSDTLSEMAGEGLLEIGQKDYVFTAKGRQELETMAEQYHSLVEHYDVFAHVDIDEGCFLEPGDDPKEQVNIEGQYFDRFMDLRSAVMRFKGISPFDMVFLNLLREGRIAASDNWEFDMALGKALYAELEEIVNSAYTVKELTDLGKRNDDGEIPGSDILKDVIVAGNKLNQERQMAAQSQKNYDAPASDRKIQVEIIQKHRPEVYHHRPMFVEYDYDPYDYYDYYDDPFYVEPIWRHHHYRPWF